MKKAIQNIGLPTFIICAFWILILVVGFFCDLSVPTLLSDTLKRAGMNGILVLAMLPSIQSGTGPNFALPVGIVCGLFALVCSIEFGFTGWAWFFVSILLATALAIVVGYLYGKLINAVKGSEMTIATYTGFSIVAFMCLLWLMIPFTSPNMGWFIGQGLRETIQLDVIDAAQILNNLWAIQIGPDFTIPTGMILFFLLFCFIIWLFFRSKRGIAISAVGSSNEFAQASGISINKNRVFANILTTVLGAIGIVVYSQSYGYAQLYSGPLMMAFPAVAAVLIGGATAMRGKVMHVIIGVVLFQGLLTAALPVANKVFAGTDLSEVLRMVIQNGIILYALTQVKKGGSKG
ncbi:ABC transporter permease subunit [Hominifimenecus sp. rT4P-3]|uniref:ABC transporter permease subunit n=1 Tax=Hominifimenecus sp. rT4P-3 TaxID=3242979 RepID=UPI003DA2FD47